MKARAWLLFSVIIPVQLWCGIAVASDVAREKHWLQEMAAERKSGEGLWLVAEGHKFAALYRKPTGKEIRGGIILMHGLDSYPDDKFVIKPLRVAFPDEGWHTLSIQMPVLPQGAKPQEYVSVMKEVAPRIDAAVKYLKTQGVSDIVVFGHDLGATMAASWLAGKPDSSVKAFVAIGAATGLLENAAWDYLTSVEKFKLPVLDICGERDHADVLGSARPKMLSTRRADLKAFVQMQVNGADHKFSGHEQDLLRSIRAWLDHGVPAFSPNGKAVGRHG